MPMEIVLEPGPVCTTLKIIGSVTLAEVERLRTDLLGLTITTEIPAVLVDCSALDSLDDSAISELVNFIREMERVNRPVRLFGLSPTVLVNLDRLGIRAMLPHSADRDAALAAIRPKA